jgi:CMP-2-keto-3-deoxyoctulosonic acid synthetase
MLMLGALNIIDNTRKIQIANAGAGDLIMTNWSSTLGHTRIVTEVKKTDADYFVVWYQGNLPPVIPERREGNFSEIGNVFENRPRRWNFAQFS